MPEPAARTLPLVTHDDQTEVGSYFVATYPPFSVWQKSAVASDALPALKAPSAGGPLGLYLHIPFCRKRCHFCYFRVSLTRTRRMSPTISIWSVVSGICTRACRRSKAVVSTSCISVEARRRFSLTTQLERLVTKTDVHDEVGRRGRDHVRV